MKKFMSLERSVTLSILLISIILWIVLLFNPGNIMTIEHCHVSLAGPSEASLQMLLQMNPVSDMMIGWILMVFAMMLPKLIFPILHICKTSFKHKRFLLSILFVLGYALVWTLVGFVMNAFILGANLYMPNSFVPACIIGAIAIVWQFSPIKQTFLNKGHDHQVLSAFGWAANKDAFTFGLAHGLWCVCSGWAIMLFPMLLPQGHNIAMLLVTFIMISEHMEHPDVPKWKLDFRLKLLRVLIAKIRLRFI